MDFQSAASKTKLNIIDDFYGELVECELAVFFYFEGGAEGRVVFLERFQYGRELVLEQVFDFFVGEFALIKHLRNAKATLRVHAHVSGVCGLVCALARCSAAET